ncbi:hypothetical protein LIER_38505 [Lithospermum erythrorhizon]|uniref:Retrovirus-related Pol polyprotein from transposon TNT 1-94 n=1 Tax=Lithospermum erythrorhizon TaxID=34254 RepID=A0AAV3Q433_LITER
MNDYLQLLHSLYTNLQVVGESDLVAQILLGLPPTFNAFITGILGQSLSMPPPMMASAKCQICGMYKHEALDCNDLFNHVYVSNKLDNSLAAMHIDEAFNIV